MKKLTIKDLLDNKGKKQLTEINDNNSNEAAACELAGIDMLVTSENNNVTEMIDMFGGSGGFTVGYIMYLKKLAKDQPEKFEFNSSSLEAANKIISKYPKGASFDASANFRDKIKKK